MAVFLHRLGRWAFHRRKTVLMAWVLALVALINGLLTWIGRGFGLHHLTLQLVLRYVFYPVTFLMGVPRPEILKVSEILATKLVAA